MRWRVELGEPSGQRARLPRELGYVQHGRTSVRVYALLLIRTLEDLGKGSKQFLSLYSLSVGIRSLNP